MCLVGLCVIPGWRPFDWFPTYTGLTPGADQSYYTPTTTYRTVTIRYNGFTSYTNPTTYTTGWQQIVYTVDPQMGDIASITVSDSVSGTVYTRTVNGDGSISTTGSMAALTALVSPPGFGGTNFFNYLSGSRTPTFCQFQLTGTAGAPWNANYDVQYTLSDAFTISSALATAEGLADAIPVTGSVTAYTSGGGTTSVNVDALNCVGVTTFGGGGTTPNVLYNFYVRQAGGIATIYAYNWFATTGTFTTPYAFDVLTGAGYIGGVGSVPGNIFCNGVDDTGTSGTGTGGGNYDATMEIDPNNSFDNLTGSYHGATYATTQIRVCMTVEACNTINAFGVVWLSGATKYQCHDLICLGSFHVYSTTYSMDIDYVYGYDVNPNNDGFSAETASTACTSIALDASAMPGYACSPAGIFSINCAGGPVLIKGENAPEFGYIVAVNAGCCMTCGGAGCVGQTCNSSAHPPA